MANTSEVQGHMLIRSRMGVSVDGFVATPDGLPAWREVPGSRACQVSELGHVGRVTSARSAVGQLSRQAGGLGGQVVLLAEVRGAGGRGAELSDGGLGVTGQVEEVGTHRMQPVGVAEPLAETVEQREASGR